MSGGETEEEPKKSNRMMLVIIIVAVNVVLGGGAAAFFLLRGGSGGSHSSSGGHGGGGGHGGEEEDHGGGGGDHGGGGGGHGAAAEAAKSGAPIMEFPPIIVNLNEPEGTRYLKTTVAIQLVDRHIQSEVEQLKPVIKDAFIRDLSELNFRQTMGAKNKSVIKRRLLKRFNEALGSDGGVEVLFTDFVVQ